MKHITLNNSIFQNNEKFNVNTKRSFFKWGNILNRYEVNKEGRCKDVLNPITNYV